MEKDVLMFGIAREINGGPSCTLTLGEDATIGDIRKALAEKYSEFHNLTSFMVAKNSEYAEDTEVIAVNDEIAIIPPVSGG